MYKYHSSEIHCKCKFSIVQHSYSRCRFCKMEFIRRLNQIKDREAKCVEGTCLFWAGQFSYRPTPLPIGCLHKFFSRSGWKAAGIIKPSAIPGQILLWIWLKMVGNGQSRLLPQIYVFLKPSVGFTVILTLWWYSYTVCSDTRHQIWSIHFPASRSTSTSGGLKSPFSIRIYLSFERGNKARVPLLLMLGRQNSVVSIMISSVALIQSQWYTLPLPPLFFKTRFAHVQLFWCNPLTNLISWLPLKSRIL